MERARLAEVVRVLPLFPLARTVLMPGSLLPLHVFEPRYRALVQHCLDGDRVMGIATLDVRRPPDPVAPALHEQIGLGEIVSHQPFPDGRCNIVLQHVGTGQLRRELASPHPFRLAECELMDEPVQGTAEALRDLRFLVLQLSTQIPESSAEGRRLVELPEMELPDSLARRLLTDPEDQRRYLGAPPSHRVAMVSDRLAAFLVSAPPVGSA
ncbi:MAG: LON peptidase substrate-binding domain-containing protein [Alphaproteobacteria bacterium]|nr:LON peptidase substrate-binding domain-containing protein [Alphaproteobacteria bacterium]MCB9696547.1 LON peptidase substrate-binding domain-containing protein [Alphaproteobacteria bacterium]